MVRFLHGDFSVKGNHTEEGVLEIFKEETRERGIPEENVMNILKTGSGIKLFFLNINQAVCTCAIGKQTDACKLSSFIHNLLYNPLLKEKQRKIKTKTLEILANGCNSVSFIPTRLFFPQMTVLSSG